MNTDQVINLVEAHRDHMGEARKFPDGADNMIFALEEAGEFFDAWMRQDSSFQRNNDRQIDPAKEAADLMYMIASAIIAIRRGNVGRVEPKELALAQIVERLSYAMVCLQRNAENAALNNLEDALEQTLALCTLLHYGPAAILQAKIDRDNARYLQPVTMQKGA